MSSAASSCFIFYQTSSTDGQSVIPENFPDACLSHFLLWFLSDFISSGCTGQSMESIPSSSVMKKPGETLSLSCRGSGFTFSCCVMSWIRQPAGKRLEWMGSGYSDASRNTYASSVRGRVEISRDDSNSMVHLRLSNLKPEDSAVYYCVGEPGFRDSRTVIVISPQLHSYFSISNANCEDMKLLLPGFVKR